jgi:hypothetical protein
MIKNARYVHTSVVARDWRSLAAFYQSVLGYEPASPERDLGGSDFEAGTGVPGSRVTGIHLRLTGGGIDGPTLEILEHSRPAAALHRSNRGVRNPRF